MDGDEEIGSWIGNFFREYEAFRAKEIWKRRYL